MCVKELRYRQSDVVFFVAPTYVCPGSKGGNIMQRALDFAMHNYAQLCTMHFDENTRGLQTREILELLTFCRLAAGGIPRSSAFSNDGRISSSCKASSAVETCPGAFWWTKLSMLNTTTNCIGHQSRRTLCTIRQIRIMHDYAQLCTCIMPPPPPCRKCSARRTGPMWRAKYKLYYPVWRP